MRTSILVSLALVLGIVLVLTLPINAAGLKRAPRAGSGQDSANKGRDSASRGRDGAGAGAGASVGAGVGAGAGRDGAGNHGGFNDGNHGGEQGGEHGGWNGGNHGGSDDHHGDDHHGGDHDWDHRRGGYPYYGGAEYPYYGASGVNCNTAGASYCSNYAPGGVCPAPTFANLCVCYTDGTCATQSGSNACYECGQGNVVSVKEDYVCGTGC